MAQLTIDISGNRGLATKVGTFPYKTQLNNNLRYLESDKIVAGIYNPNRIEGYIAPAIKDSINLEISNVEDFIYNTEPFGFSGIVSPITIPNAPLSRWFLNGSNLFVVDANKNTVDIIKSNITKNIQDIIFYQKHLYYIYENNIHRQEDSDIQTSGILPNLWMTNIADNPKELESVSSNAVFVEGNNNLLYVLDNNKVHSIDSSVAVSDEGRIDAEILTFPEYVRLMKGLDFKNKLYIIYSENSTIESNESTDKYKSPSRKGVFVWNKRSIVGTQSDIIFLEGVNNINDIFQDGHAIYVVVVSSGGTTQIRRFNGANFDTIFEFSSEKDDNFGIDEKVQSRLSIKTTEQGTFFVTNFGEVYLMTFGGGVFHKINSLQDIPASDYEGLEISKVNNSVDITNDVAHNETSGLSISVVNNNTARISLDGFETFTDVSLPTGTFNAIAYNDSLDRFVIVGSGTDNILYSTDGSAWTGVSTGSEEWKHITSNGTGFVAVGTDGDTAYSNDGISWTVNTPVGSVNFERVAYSDVLSLYVAGTDEGQIYSSSDRITWTERIQKETGDFRDMTYNSTGYYVIRENAGKLEVLRSQDLKEFIVTVDSTTYKDAQEIVSLGDDLFVSVGISGKILKITSNGTSLDDSKSISGGNVTRLRVTNNVLFALSTTGKMETTTDGTTWDERTTTISTPLYDVVYVPESAEDEGDDFYIAVGYTTIDNTTFVSGGYSLISTDLSTWNVGNSTKVNATRIAYGNNMLVCSSIENYSNNAQPAFAYSTNRGSSWLFQNSIFQTSQQNNPGIAINREGLVVYLSKMGTGTVDHLFSSKKSDKYKNWNITGIYRDHGFITNPLKTHNIIWTNGQFGTSYEARATVDGINYTSFGNDEHWFIAYGDGKYVAVGYDRLRISTNGGISFTSNGTLSLNTLGIAYGNGAFICTTSTSKIMLRSTNGLSWTQKIANVPTQTMASTITFTNGYFFGQISGTLYRSLDGLTWSAVPTASPVSGRLAVDETLGRVIVYSTTQYAVSNDSGVTWTTYSFPITVADTSYGSASFENGISVIVGNATVSRYPIKLINYDYTLSTGWHSMTTEGMKVKDILYHEQSKKFVAIRDKTYNNEIEYITFTNNINSYEWGSLENQRESNTSSLEEINNTVYLTNSITLPRILSTTNFLTWNGLSTTLATGAIVDIEYIDKFYATTKGNILAINSEDGINWLGFNSLQRPASYIAYSPDKNYTAIAGGNIIYSSQDLQQFSLNVIDSYNQNPYEHLYTSQIYWNKNIDRMVYMTPMGIYHLDGIKTISPGVEEIDTRKVMAIEYFGYYEDYINDIGTIRSGTPTLNIGYEVMNKGLTNGVRMLRIPINHTSTIEGHPNNNNIQNFSLDLYPHQGDVLTGVTLLPKMSTLRDITIYCAPTEDDGEEIMGWIDVYINQQKEPFYTKTVTRKEAHKGYLWFDMNKPNTRAVQFGVRWNKEHKTGDNDMLLSQAVLYYDAYPQAK